MIDDTALETTRGGFFKKLFGTGPTVAVPEITERVLGTAIVGGRTIDLDAIVEAKTRRPIW